VAKSPYARFGVSSVEDADASPVRHIVVGGETIPAIAAVEYNTGYDSELWRQVAEGNVIDDIEAITVGTSLNIPLPKPSET